MLEGETSRAGSSEVRRGGGGYEFDRLTEKVSEYLPAYCWEEGSTIKKEGDNVLQVEAAGGEEREA